MEEWRTTTLQSMGKCLFHDKIFDICLKVSIIKNNNKSNDTYEL